MFKFEKQILKISFFFTILGSIIFFSLWNINNSLAWGWIIGCGSSIINFLVLIGFTQNVLQNSKKKRAFLLFALKFIFVILFNGSVFFLIVFVNKRYSGFNLWWSGLDGIQTPINLITYFCGISIVGISIFLKNLLQIVSKRKENNGKNSRKLK